MDQVHGRFTTEQVGVLLKGYRWGTLDGLATELKEKEIAFLDLLFCSSRIPPPRTSFACGRNAWSTAIGRYLYSIMIYQSYCCGVGS